MPICTNQMMDNANNKGMLNAMAQIDNSDGSIFAWVTLYATAPISLLNR